MIEFAPYRFDPLAGCLWRGDEPVALRPKAWELLRFLVERPGLLVTKDEIHAAVWGEAIVSDDTLTHTLAELRHALSDDARTPRFIETVHRRGVRFIARMREAEAGALAGPSSPGPGAMPTTEAEAAILVGRDAELSRLRALFRQAVAGHRQVVFVEGEAGIGKSAIVEAFLGAARTSSEPILIGYGQCVEQYAEREPYMPVLEALERICHGPARDRMLSVLRSVAPSWLARMPSLQRPGDADRLRRWHLDTTPHRMLREFATLVETVSTHQPLVLVLEDLHWSDRATVDLFSVLAQRPERARVMLIGTCRPAQAAALQHPIQQVLALLRARSRCVEIPVEYLTRSDVGLYLERRLGSRVDEEVTAATYAHTDGNPLFMTVLTDHLLARGWLARDEEFWRLRVARSTIEREVPDNTRQLIEGQLRFLSAAEQDTLEVASVAGVTFEVPSVAAGTGGTADAVETTCHRLSQAQRWLRHLGSREWPDGSFAARYAFRHALYQRTLYDRLSPGRRAALHARIGRRLEQGYAGRTGEVSGELARHFQGGREPRRALVYLEQAARHAHDRLAYGDVIACLEPAIALLGELPDTSERARDELRLRRLYTSVLSQTAAERMDAVVENLNRSQALSEQVGDVPAQFDTLGALYLLRSTRGNLREAEEIGDGLTQLSERLDASAVLQSDFLRGSAALWAGNLSAAEPLLARALASPVSVEAAERHYGVNPAVAVRSFEGLRRWLVGDPARAREVQLEAAELAQRLGRPFPRAQVSTFRAFVLVLDEDWTEVERLATEVIRLAEEYGFPRWHGRALVVRGRALVEAGDANRGLTEISDGLQMLRQSGWRLGSSLLFSILAGACLRVDRVKEGLAATEAGLRHGRETGERCFESELWRLQGELIRRSAPSQGSARRTRMPGADECFAKARAVARAQGAHMLARRADLGVTGGIAREVSGGVAETGPGPRTSRSSSRALSSPGS
jgi:DNA-binding winged helix-turn-helix (wHTH) protein